MADGLEATLSRLLSHTVMNGTLTDGNMHTNRFLWVRFQLDEICEATTDDAIRLAIQNLPKDLAETYARILAKIWNSPGGGGKFGLAEQIFKWIICARRPLTVQELSEAVAIRVHHDSLDTSKVPSSDGYFLQRSCGNLLTVDRNDQTVRLAHHTVRKFLISEQAPFRRYGYIDFTETDIEVDIGVLCVTYLSFSDFEIQIAKRDPGSMIANASVIQANLWRQIPYGQVISNLLSTRWTNPTLDEGQTLHVNLAINHPRESPQETFQENYFLLDYIASFWPWHTSKFTEHTVSEEIWNLFRDLTFRRNFLFNTRPWIAMQLTAADQDKSLPHLSLLRWTVDENISSFLLLIFRMGNGYKSQADWQTFKAYFSHERKNGVNLLLRASRRGNFKAFNSLVYNFLFESSPCRGFLDDEDLILQVASTSAQCLECINRFPSPIQSALYKAIEIRNCYAVQSLLLFGGGTSKLCPLGWDSQILYWI
jgi:hypothetical protein